MPISSATERSNCLIEERSEIAKMIYGDHAKALTDPGNIAQALRGIGQGLGHLEKKERSEIAKMIDGNHAKALTDPDDIALAFEGIALGLEHLNTDERSRIIAVARHLPYASSSAARDELTAGVKNWTTHLLALKDGALTINRQDATPDRGLDERSRSALVR